MYKYIRISNVMWKLYIWNTHTYVFIYACAVTHTQTLGNNEEQPACYWVMGSYTNKTTCHDKAFSCQIAVIWSWFFSLGWSGKDKAGESWCHKFSTHQTFVWKCCGGWFLLSCVAVNQSNKPHLSVEIIRKYFDASSWKQPSHKTVTRGLSDTALRWTSIHM